LLANKRESARERERERARARERVYSVRTQTGIRYR